MAEADTRRMSSERQQHEAHPRRPRSASKPGISASASAARRRGSSSGGGGGSGARGGGGRGGGANARGGKLSKLPRLRELSLPRPHLSIWSRIALKLLKRLAKHQLKKLMEAAAAR
jgi:hypothetical protein